MDTGAKQAAVVPEPATIRFPSGKHTLSGTLHRPHGAARAAVVLHGATGVPQRFYQPFARWLAAEQDLICMTYDYRDFGDSASRHPRLSDATMSTWGIDDQSAALNTVMQVAPGKPVWVIGHSLGGLMMNFHRNAQRIDRAFLIASGPVHWRDHPMRRLPVVLTLWYLYGPLATTLAGYLPGRLVGLGSDLPAGVFWEWRRWCTRKGFLEPDIGRSLPQVDWHLVRADLSLISISDDADITPAVEKRLADYYPAAQVSHASLDPADFGLGKVGHVGVFSRRNADMWPAILGAEYLRPTAQREVCAG